MKLGVVGGGTMGNGIAHVFAQFGHETVLVDVSDAAIVRARKTIEKNLGRQVSKEKISQEDMDGAMGRLTFTTDYAKLAGSELVVEAIFENFEAKNAVYDQVKPHLGDGAILASNTSSISITQLATAADMAENFIGMHFMNPVPMMKLVEVIRGHDTSDATCAKVTELATALGKTPIECNDYPGFCLLYTSPSPRDS